MALRIIQRLLSVSLALSLAACAMEVVNEDDVAGELDEDVAVSVQPLGGWEQLWRGRALVGSFGSDYFVGTTDEACSKVLVVMLRSGTQLQAPALPTCGRVHATASHGTTIYVAANERIYSWQTTSKAPPAWFAMAVAPDVSGMLADASYVYWGSSTGVYRASINGAFATMYSTAATLKGIENGAAYIQDSANGSRRLQRVKIGSPTTLIRTQSTDFTELAFDATHFYWIEVGTSFKMLRMTKAGGSFVTLRESSTVQYRDPISNGTSLYWHETVITNGTERISRMTLAGGAVSTQPMPAPLFYAMFTLSPTDIHLFARGLSIEDGDRIYRGTL